jgi:hypothetical protein
MTGGLLARRSRQGTTGQCDLCRSESLLRNGGELGRIFPQHKTAAGAAVCGVGRSVRRQRTGSPGTGVARLLRRSRTKQRVGGTGHTPAAIGTEPQPGGRQRNQSRQQQQAPEPIQDSSAFVATYRIHRWQDHRWYDRQAVPASRGCEMATEDFPNYYSVQIGVDVSAIGTKWE